MKKSIFSLLAITCFSIIGCVGEKQEYNPPALPGCHDYESFLDGKCVRKCNNNELLDLQNNKCSPKCDETQWFDIQSSVCVPRTACNDGEIYNYDKNDCIKSVICDNGQIFDLVKLACSCGRDQVYDSNKKECVQRTKEESCTAGKLYDRETGKCQDKVSCADGEFLNQLNNTCVKNCPNLTYLDQQNECHPLDLNGNHMRDNIEFERYQKLSGNGKDYDENCSANENEKCKDGGFCDSSIGYRCSVKCQSDDDCVPPEGAYNYVCRSDGRCAPDAFVTEWLLYDTNESISFFIGQCDRFSVDWGDGSKNEYICRDLKENILNYDKETKCAINSIDYYNIKEEDIFTLNWCAGFRKDGRDGDDKIVDKVCLDHEKFLEKDNNYWVCNNFDSRILLKHTYNQPGRYIVKLRGSNINGIGVNLHDKNSSDKVSKLIAIHSFGPVGIGPKSFANVGDIVISSIDIPDAALLTSMNMMFYHSAFNAPIGNWDVSHVTNMDNTFDGAKGFNQNIGNWDVSNVNSMNMMFNEAKSFDQEIGNWDVSKVQSMGNMFNNAIAFNQNISNWKPHSCSSFYQMFKGAEQFNNGSIQGDDKPLNWNENVSKNVSKNEGVIFESMFEGAKKFNQDISNWDVSKGTNFRHMFWNAEQFNQDLNWNVSNGTDFHGMFAGALKFNQDISNWNVSNGTDFSSMFYEAESFDGDLSKWNVSSGTNFQVMFAYAKSFNSDISQWKVNNGKCFCRMFYEDTNFNQDLTQWEVSDTANFRGMFYGSNICNSCTNENCIYTTAWKNKSYEQLCSKESCPETCPE